MSNICPRCGSENDDNAGSCANCGVPIDSGLINDRYRIIKPWVFSTFRAVYHAEDVREQKQCSIREFLPQTITPAQSVMAKNRFQALMAQFSQLQNENMAGITDYFIKGNYFYIVYDYIDGMDITRYLENRKILTGTGYPERLVSHWTLQVCDLLAYLHHGFDSPIHVIDLKPVGLVFHKPDESLKFIDMGLFRLLEILGPHYIITEDFQAYKKSRGKFESIGWDLFCLGNVMYYLLTGIDLIKIPGESYRPIRSIRPEISAGMEEIVTRAVGQNGQSDYDDVRKIQSDLQQSIPPLPLKYFDFAVEFTGRKLEPPKTDWKMLLGNSRHTGIIGEAPQPLIRLKWATKTRSSEQSFISVGNNHVYSAGREGMLHGLNAVNGQVEWVFNICHNLDTGGVVADNSLYFLTARQELVAIEHGATDFSWKLPMESSSLSIPFISGNILFVTLYNGTIKAVNRNSGEILAQYPIEGNIISTPVFSNNVIYITSLNKRLYAIDVDTEDFRWDFEAESSFSSSPTLLNNAIYIGSHDGTVYAIEMEEGNIIWSRNFSGSVTQTIRASEDMLYILCNPGKLVAVDAKRGETVWTRELGSKTVEYPMCLGSNLIFLADSGKNLLCLNALTGEERQSLKISQPIASSLIGAHKSIYLVTKSGHVASFGK